MLKKIQCFIEGMMSVVSRGNSLETERYNTPGMHLTLSRDSITTSKLYIRLISQPFGGVPASSAASRSLIHCMSLVAPAMTQPATNTIALHCHITSGNMGRESASAYNTSGLDSQTQSDLETRRIQFLRTNGGISRVVLRQDE